ncbi:MAG TPA: glycosyltransferase [Candidatus Babeliales bacterium]|nr:glycosyltransferase [Candidatus Babeliales bacterium]
MKVSIVIPAYNEEKRITRTLESYVNYFRPFARGENLHVELLVVLNGCKDNTHDVVEQLREQYSEIRMLDLKAAGKGLAIAAGFKDALTRPNDLIGFVDADMATAPEYFYDLIKKINGYDGIIASRYMPGADVYPPRPRMKYWGRRLVYDKLVFLLFGMNYYDLQCGAKLFKREVIEKIVSEFSVRQWAFDVELLYLAKKYGFKVKEIPTVWRDQADSKLTPVRSGLRMLSAVIKLRVRHSPFKGLVAPEV